MGPMEYKLYNGADQITNGTLYNGTAQITLQDV